MAPTAASVASLAEGLARVPRPISAAPVPSVSAIAQNATPRVFNSATRSIESGLSRAARPYPYTAVSQQIGLERAGMARARAALGSVEAQIARKSEATLARQALASAARARVAGVASRASVAVAETGGLLTRIPLVGTVLEKVPPLAWIAGPFLAVAALQAIPDILQIFAPGVHGWLAGGWRGQGSSLADNTAGTIIPGTRAVPYRVVMETDATLSDGSPLTSTRVEETFQGPLRIGTNDYGRRGISTTASGDAQAISYTLFSATPGIAITSYVIFLNAPGNRVKFSFFPLDGVVEGNPQSPTATNPKPQPPALKTAENARNTALAAVAVTIAAGKLKLNPPPSRDALKTPQRRIGPQSAPSPTQTAPATNPCKGNSCGQAGLDQSKENGEELKKLFDYLEKLGLAEAILKINRIDEGVGPTIKDERGRKIGLSGHAIKMFEKLNKVGDYLRFDRITNVLTLAATVHNAAMLSNQLEQTLAQALSSALAVIGIKDSEGNQLDINKIVGKSVENTIKGAIGAQNYTELTTNWKKANRIYQAGANLINNVQSLRYSITGALETIAGMNGKVANALKKYGVLGDNAYPWMNPSPNFDNKFMRGLETTQNAVSNIDSIASEVLSAQQTVEEIGKQKTELEKAVKDGTEKAGVDNTQQKEKATAAKTASKSPDVNPIDLVKPGGI